MSSDRRPSLTELGIELLGRMRDGIDTGMEPVTAAGTAIATLPAEGRNALVLAGRRLSGAYHEDEWGFDEDLAEGMFPLLDFLYQSWWRVSAEGISQVPSHGRALLVANQGGGPVPWDAAMISTAIMREHPLPRWPRVMGDDLAFGLPFASNLVRRLGGVPTTPRNAMRILDSDELLLTFPEGPRRVRKPVSERYRLERFGRGGFVEVALRTRSPIIPIAVVGAEEIYAVWEASATPRLAGVPGLSSAPLAPWLGLLGLLPLPARWRIEVCEPVDIGAHPAEAADDPRTVLEISDEVRERIQAKLIAGVARRGAPFS